jgi:hypothetical protein
MYNFVFGEMTLAAISTGTQGETYPTVHAFCNGRCQNLEIMNGSLLINLLLD